MKRTSLIIDDDLEPKLRRLVQVEGKSLRKVVNELLRVGFSVRRATKQKEKTFHVQAFDSGFLDHVDPLKLNSLNDECETEEPVD